MYGEIDKIKLGKILFPNWRNILSQNKVFTVKKKPMVPRCIGIIEVHSIIEFR